ncbi:MAG TPA: hypothetical protein VMR25_17300 [Planctomycetaceae bacterium]|jgi:hypothetical protein|nr:hypothetical protein [Planctomycetaceae bacterium]
MTSKDDEKTESEALFEAFCTALSIPWDRVPRSRTKTPDYVVTLGGHRVVTEVKQIEPGDDDKRLLAAGAAWSDPGRRVRQKIQASSKQLRARSGGTLPTLLVLYDLGTFRGTDSDDVKTAMFGDESATVRRLPGEALEISPIQPGGHRKCTEQSNTSISAIALMRPFETYGARLALFHNHFAAIHIDPEWCRVKSAIQHFALSDEVYAWREV